MTETSTDCDPAGRCSPSEDNLYCSSGPKDNKPSWEPWRTDVYKPLDSTQSEIRILKLLPNPRLADDPECILYTIPLGQTRFAAISYVWGDSSKSEKLILNGHRISITASAHIALRYVRLRSSRMKHIWLDPLCINQMDTQERSQQVELMGQIFSIAKPVWLRTGPYTKDVKFFRKVKKRLDMKSTDHSAFLKYLSIDEWDSLEPFLNRALSPRVWILQELLMSGARGEATLLFGHCGMNYDDLMVVVQTLLIVVYILAQSGEQRLPVGKILFTLTKQNALKHAYAEGQANVVDIFGLNNALEATDPRDRVYGWLGITRVLRIQPDYGKSVKRVYQEAILEVIKQTGSLNIFLHCDQIGEAHHVLPSWTIDWDKQRKCSSRSALSKAFDGCADLYHACAGEPPGCFIPR